MFRQIRRIPGFEGLLAAAVTLLAVSRNNFVLGDCFGVLLPVDGAFA